MKTRTSYHALPGLLILLILAAIAAAPAFGQLQDAVDNFTLTFGNDPGPANEQWYRVTDVSHDGVDSARSGSSVGNGDDSGFSTTVTGPGTISFWWKVSSQDNQDGLAFITEDPEGAYSYKAYIAGNPDWEYKEYEIPAGDYTLYWSYMKDYQYSFGSDCGWVDQIVWTPGGGPDTTPPGAVADFTAMPGDGRVSLSWTNPGDADFAGVRILARTVNVWPDGPNDPLARVVYEGSDEEFVDWGLDNGLRYYYRAYAYDGVPNYSDHAQAWTHPGQMACCGVSTGFAARVQFEWMYDRFGGHYINFDDRPSNTALNDEYQATHGVTFWTTKSYNGTPFGTPHNVRVSNATSTSPPNSIVGTPSIYSGDDGRYAYEARFDEPQRWAGIVRCWSTWSTDQITRFYSPSGALLAEVNVYPQNFAGYIACSSDTNDWVAKIECDGVSPQPGYSDDLFFGTGPEPVGDLAWDYFYDDGGADTTYDAALDSQGDVYVAGSHTATGETAEDALLYRVTPGSNSHTWAEVRDLPGEPTRGDRYHDVCVDAQDNAIAVGFLGAINAVPYARSIVSKIGPDGSNHWEHTWYDAAGGGTEAYAYGVDIAPDGTIYVGAQVDVGVDNDFRWEVLEYAPTGFVGVIDSMTYHAPDSSYTYRNIPFKLAVHDDHSICQVGRVGDNANSRVNWHVRYYDGSHALVWEDTHPAVDSGLSSYAFGVDMDADGNPIVAGYRYMPGGTRTDGLIVKYDATDGSEMWHRKCEKGEGVGFVDVEVVGDHILVSGWCTVDGVNYARLLKLRDEDGTVVSDQTWYADGGYARSVNFRDGRIAVGLSGSSDAGVAVLDSDLVVDTTPPQIVLQGDNPLDLARGTAYVEPGFTATDDLDGDVTASVTVTGSVDHTVIGTYMLYYNVADSNGNAAVEQVRTVQVVDRTPPQIVLQGDNPFTLDTGTPFVDPGYTATDDVDGDLTGQVSVTGSVDHTVSGTYMLYYNVADSNGNAAIEQVRTVDVVDPSGPPPAAQPFGPSGTVDATRRPEFSWSDVPRAAWYFVVIEKDGKAYYQKWFNVTSWTPTWDLGPGDYTWQVQTWNQDGLGPWSIEATFDIPTRVPGKLDLYTPGGYIDTAQPDFTWEDDKDAEWYQLVVNREDRRVIKLWTQDTTHTPAPLQYGRYDWWVQGWGLDGLGPWSDESEFTYGNVELKDPQGIVQGTGRPEFTWSGPDDAQWFQLLLNRNGQKYYSKWFPQDSWMPFWDLPFGKYDWWVQPWNPQGVGPWSGKASFTMGEAVPTNPVGAQLGSPTAVGWDNSGCAPAQWYQVWIGGDGYTLASFWVPVADTYPVGGKVFADIPADAQPLPAGNHMWYLRAWQPSGLGPWSSAEFSVP